MFSVTRHLLPLVLPAVLVLGSCSDGEPASGPDATPEAVTTEQGLVDLIKGAGASILPGSECQGTTKTTTGNRFEFHSKYTCVSCRKSAIKYYDGLFARALAKKGWQRTALPLPTRMEFRKGKERLVVEVGTDAQAAVDNKLRTFITHGLH